MGSGACLLAWFGRNERIKEVLRGLYMLSVEMLLPLTDKTVVAARGKVH